MRVVRETRAGAAAAIGIGLAALALPSPASGAPAEVSAGDIDSPELVKTIPVAGKKKGQIKLRPRVVMQLAPGQIPDLAPGDLLRAMAELEVTTQCDVGQGGQRCSYNPKVRAALVLSGSGTVAAPPGTSLPFLGANGQPAERGETCTKSEHHCVLVFGFDDATLRLVGSPPCAATQQCYINLVAWAKHPKAQKGDRLLIGENNGNFLRNGDVDPDKGRLMVIRDRGAQTEVSTENRGQMRIPTNKRPTKFFSAKLKDGDLNANSRYAIEVTVRARAKGRARLSSKMFLTKNRGADDGNGIEGTTPGAISEHNGINCSGGCTFRRVAVFSVDRDVSGPVFVNVHGRGAQRSPGARVEVLGATARIIRYRAGS
jgi:hypothetical protein